MGPRLWAAVQRCRRRRRRRRRRHRACQTQRSHQPRQQAEEAPWRAVRGSGQVRPYRQASGQSASQSASQPANRTTQWRRDEQHKRIEVSAAQKCAEEMWERRRTAVQFVGAARSCSGLDGRKEEARLSREEDSSTYWQAGRTVLAVGICSGANTKQHCPASCWLVAEQSSYQSARPTDRQTD